MRVGRIRSRLEFRVFLAQPSGQTLILRRFITSQELSSRSGGSVTGRLAGKEDNSQLDSISAEIEDNTRLASISDYSSAGRLCTARKATTALTTERRLGSDQGSPLARSYDDDDGVPRAVH